jgi:hypothetical protein
LTLFAPLHDRDPREAEREIEQRTRELEGRFEQRVADEVRRLADPDAFEAAVERRARAIVPLDGRRSLKRNLCQTRTRRRRLATTHFDTRRVARMAPPD